MRAIIPLRIQVKILPLQKYAKARLASRLLRKSKKKRKKITYENHTRGVGKYEKKKSDQYIHDENMYKMGKR